MITETPKLSFKDDIEKNWLLGILKTDKVSITFEKVDGTIRELIGSLDPEFLPKIEPVVLGEGEEPKEVKPRKESTTAFRVFDLEKSEFRSVRWDSIISIILL